MFFLTLGVSRQYRVQDIQDREHYEQRRRIRTGCPPRLHGGESVGMSETVLQITLAKGTTVRLTCGPCHKEAKMPLIKLASQVEKCRSCGAKIFDDRQVEAVHALADAARDIGRGKDETN